MGANVAPTYANMFVAHLEETHIYGSNHFSHVLGWWRFIDYIFLVWNVTVDELNELQFTLLWSREALQFLDTLVTLNNSLMSETQGISERQSGSPS